ncbi:hypothetical protein C8R45DRAFT_1084293 [Mycena sanguinolenta]|nr:hypothetical protein C8R45DRAFT_1084293 [Mycena sanguinolenta]
MKGKRPRREEMDICRLQTWLLEVASARWQRGPVHRDGGGSEEEGRVGFTERDVSDLVETDAVCRFFHRVSDLKTLVGVGRTSLPLEKKKDLPPFFNLKATRFGHRAKGQVLDLELKVLGRGSIEVCSPAH